MPFCNTSATVAQAFCRPLSRPSGFLAVMRRCFGSSVGLLDSENLCSGGGAHFSQDMALLANNSRDVIAHKPRHSQHQLCFDFGQVYQLKTLGQGCGRCVFTILRPRLFPTVGRRETDLPSAPKPCSCLGCCKELELSNHNGYI